MAREESGPRVVNGFTEELVSEVVVCFVVVEVVVLVVVVVAVVVVAVVVVDVVVVELVHADKVIVIGRGSLGVKQRGLCSIFKTRNF